MKVLDYKAEREAGEGDYSIYRIVEILWTIDCDRPPSSAKSDEVFGYSEVLKYQSGDVMELETLRTFKQRWDNNGSLGAFQEYVRDLFKLS